MGITDDAKLLVDYLTAKGITEPDPVKAGWPHMGAIVLDAVLQANRDYELVVRPRVVKFIEQHPEARTTTGFLAVSESSDLAAVVNYHSATRMKTAISIAELFRENAIETHEDLTRALTDPTARQALRDQLLRIKHVGDKTVGYFDILVGLDTGTAVDSRVLGVFAEAGITSPTYAHSEAIIRAAAEVLGWPVGGLDAVLWRIGDGISQT